MSILTPPETSLVLDDALQYRTFRGRYHVGRDTVS
jgi:hypothetical protein